MKRITVNLFRVSVETSFETTETGIEISFGSIRNNTFDLFVLHAALGYVLPTAAYTICSTVQTVLPGPGSVFPQFPVLFLGSSSLQHPMFPLAGQV